MSGRPGWSARQLAMLAEMGLALPVQASAPAVAEAVAAPPTAAAGLAPVSAPLPPAAPAALVTPVTPVTPVTAQAGAWTDLDQLAEAVRACRACGLCDTRRQAVPGAGHARAHWMVVGEAPGEQEDREGLPFVGASGQLLDAMLDSLGLSRAPGSAERQVYIANSIKCRPPGNRNPSPEELSACAPYLKAQLALVQPRVVLALGRFAVKALLGSDEAIGRLRGRRHQLADGTPVVVSYHPAYLLRQPLEKARAWDDLCLAAELAEEAGR